ncbi:MAG: hypothetical protein GY804_01230 [Alphaproteobacteria bacterium]|nr:hypothetical protein [Alphaproteobacteria bacterium]
MSDYYVLERENNDNYPLLEWVTNESPFYKGIPVDVTEVIHFKLGWPIPQKPQMVDFHSNPRPVISDKIRNILLPLEINGIQICPATIDDAPTTNVNYWYLHIYNEIGALDREFSNFSISKFTGKPKNITKVVLNKKIFDDIPLEDRLIFELKEGAAMFLVHESIKNKIMAVIPVGIRFIDVEEWTDGSAFE